ncbi:MAG: hypothetical protein COA58_05255 [Bacteroidetes bacterium]|nr:MAG: hypothetical protein COA58_05255 [Bacteroidota bacterium]
MEEIIENYLLGKLSKEENANFEQRINTDTKLAKEVQLQRELMQAVKLQGLKADISNAWKHVRMGKMIKTGFIAIVAAAVLSLGIYYITQALHQENVDHTEVGANLPSNLFEIDNTRDTVVETTEGIILHIPAYAFGDVKTYELEIKEALNTLDILEAGLSTMADSNLLATAGMFKITAKNGTVELQIADGKQITAQVPTDYVDPNIMLFDGQEDAKGNVNWVNPTKIKNYLVNRSFDDLNFYPKGYLAKVAELGYNAGNKDFTDSLYWSFDCRVLGETEEGYLEGYGLIQISENLGAPTLLNFNDYNGDQVSLTKDILKSLDPIFGNLLEEINAQFNKENAEFGVVNGTWWKINGQYLTHDDDVIVVYNSKKAISYNVSRWTSDDTQYTKELIELELKQICPSSIQALQTEKFANTYIATKEFEIRLQHLFDICDEASLNVYIQNLDKDISYADSIVASRIAPEKKEIFNRFAAQKLSNTKAASPAFAQLSAYHKKKSKAYQEAASNARNKVLAKYSKEDADKQNRDIQKSNQEWKDQVDNYNEELNTNLVEAYRQAGVTYPSPPLPKGSYIVPVTSTGWKNLDQYVTAATISRTSLKTTYNGKDISIEYHKLKIQLKNEESYDFVNVYLIPNKLPAYQKMKKNGAFYTESLNELFDYDLVCLAKKNGEYHFYKDALQKRDNTKNVTLRKTSKKKLDNLLKEYDKNAANRNVADDLFYKEQNLLYNQNLEKRKKDEAFRREIENIIWPCKAEGSLPPPSEVPSDGSLGSEFVKTAPTRKDYIMTSKDMTSYTADTITKIVTIAPRQTNLIAHLKSEYPNVYKKLVKDFDLADPTFNASFKINYCNFKKTPILVASNTEKTHQYQMDMRSKFIKAREFKKIFELCAADCDTI